jgi:hypothetical protein
MWYEIPTFSGYRIDHLGEVLSLKGAEPRVMKTWVADGHRRVMLRQNGRYVNCKISDLLSLANLHYDQEPVEKAQHVPYEAARDCCDQGHEFTPENTMRRKGRHGDIRKCKRCHRDSVARWRAKKARETGESRATA